ncbi:MAG: hypothetical protein DYG98_14965 [Haliscomenobacteraceae bacterium CHB4]|nr:hypothetical protein [Haliscomenobacteraceae bacterium CHB4]
MLNLKKQKAFKIFFCFKNIVESLNGWANIHLPAILYSPYRHPVPVFLRQVSSVRPVRAVFPSFLETKRARFCRTDQTH